MRKVINEEIGREIIDKYDNQHIHPKDLATQYNISDTTIIRFLQKNDIYNYKKHSKYYIKTKPVKVTWSQSEVEFLVKYYEIMSVSEIYESLNRRHSKRAITNKAIKLGLTQNKKWSSSEEDILRTYYPILEKEEILKMLPGRSINSIICHAMKLNIKGKSYLENHYSDEQTDFIYHNSFIMTDQQIAEKLGKSLAGVQDQRRKLGIYYLNKDYSKYVNLTKFFRAHIHDWKQKSMELCDFKCIFTGSKNFEIHHIYSFNMIMAEAFEKMDNIGLLKSLEISDYSSEELKRMLEIFLDVHDSYPLGVCLDKGIHKLFHSIYGSGGNTQNQWDEFKNNYINGAYK